jgi:hypothetical protein
MIYLLITTSLVERNFEERKRRYTNGITTALRRFKDVANCKIIIIENNGRRPTFLDAFGVEVFYTNNNQLPTINIGNKELADLKECIQHYTIRDEDFVVKLSGRYIIQEESEFMNALLLHGDTKAAIVQYGSFNARQYERTRDCVTGLIGMRASSLRTIAFTGPYGCIEWNWADAVLALPEDSVHRLRSVGLAICPGPDDYRLI